MPTQGPVFRRRALWYGNAVRIVTWNVNSVKAREERLLAYLTQRTPDVLCLQEIKVEDAKFPVEACRALGYQTVVFGQRGYNGVAILSRMPLADVQRGFGDGDDDPQARFIAATTAGVRVMSVYVPNGQAVGSEKFAYKLRWLERLGRHLAATLPAGAPAALCGDLNVAPEALDVHDPVAWEGHVLCSREERDALARAVQPRLADVVRRLRPEGGLYSWWDYRQLAFPKNHGLRIDHIFASPALAERATAAGVDRDERKGKLPSDHAPVWADFA
jgi:exodeoxyribonuclease-3